MQRALFAVILLLGGHWLTTKTPTHEETLTNEECTPDTTVMVYDTLLEQDILLENVGLTFDFLAQRVNSRMYWTEEDNLVVAGHPYDTIYLSKTSTVDGKPKMVIDSFQSQIKQAFPKDAYIPPKGYIAQYSPIAVKLMKSSNIAASIKMAQAIHESGWGTGGPATKCNNHFGIKCHIKAHAAFTKDGVRVGTALRHCQNYWDDDSDDMFRWYESIEDSFRDHNRLLQQEKPGLTANYARIWKEIPRHGNVTRVFKERTRVKSDGTVIHYPTYYKGKKLINGETYTFPYYVWMAIELRNSGYATDKDYATKIAGTVVSHKLFKLDET